MGNESDRVYVEDGVALQPMDAVRAYIELKRERKRIATRDTELVRQEGILAKQLGEYMAAGLLPHKLKELGATVYSRAELWPRLKPEVDVATAREVFQAHDLTYMYSDKPNAQSLRGFVNGYLEKGSLKSPLEQLRDNEDFPSDLLEILNVEPTDKVAVNGL